MYLLTDSNLTLKLFSSVVCFLYSTIHRNACGLNKIKMFHITLYNVQCVYAKQQKTQLRLLVWSS